MSCIDHIFLQSKAFQVNSVVVRSKLSDHYITGVTIDMSNATYKRCSNKDGNTIKKMHENLLKKALLKCDCVKLLEVSDCELMYGLIVEMFDSCYYKALVDNSAVSNRSVRCQQPWITQNIRLMLKERDKAFHKWKKCGHLFKEVFTS